MGWGIKFVPSVQLLTCLLIGEPFPMQSTTNLDDIVKSSDLTTAALGVIVTFWTAVDSWITPPFDSKLERIAEIRDLGEMPRFSTPGSMCASSELNATLVSL